jgi:hypothetical protein
VLKKIFIAFGALVLLLAIGAVVMIGPRNIRGMLLYDQRRDGSLKVGDKAPDVVLGTIDGRPDVHLADFVGAKPLVIVFGSFT